MGNCKAAEEAAAEHIFLFFFLNVMVSEEKDISHSSDWQSALFAQANDVCHFFPSWEEGAKYLCIMWGSAGLL